MLLRRSTGVSLEGFWKWNESRYVPSLIWAKVSSWEGAFFVFERFIGDQKEVFFTESFVIFLLRRIGQTVFLGCPPSISFLPCVCFPHVHPVLQRGDWTITRMLMRYGNIRILISPRPQLKLEFIIITTIIAIINNSNWYRQEHPEKNKTTAWKQQDEQKPNQGPQKSSVKKHTHTQNKTL